MKKPNIGILTFPISEAGNVPLSNLVDILEPLSNDLYLITGNDGYTFFKNYRRIHTYGIRHGWGKNTFTRILRYVYTQLKILYKLARISRSINLWIFFIGGDTLLLPVLTAKLLRKKVILASAGSSLQCSKFKDTNLSKPIEILERVNRSLSNRIIIYSPNLVKEWNLEKYKHKISIAHKHFLDFDKFKIKNKFDEKNNLVGYVGALSKEKGILNFVKAIPKILKERHDLEFLIGGNGPLFDEIKNELKNNGSYDKIKLIGWIPHDELPDYLNELKLVILPSYTEGLPNIMLEAMACGTPVLATPAGAISDIIKDGETGFIMENNSPACIAKNVLRVLKYPNIDEIVKNARELVEKEFTYEAAVERYRKILKNVQTF